MRAMTVGELMDFLNEQPREAEVLVCGDKCIPTHDGCRVTDALYIFSRKINNDNVILLFEMEG